MRRFPFIICTLAIIASCSEKGDEPIPPTPPEPQPSSGYYQAAVSDNGFASEDFKITRDFASGDRIGVFAVKEGAVLDSIDNLCVTLGDNGWETADGTMLTADSDITYYAYWPYTESLPSDVHPEGIDDYSFFSDVIDKWEVPSSQEDAGTFEAADLMTACGTANGDTLSFAMNHQMFLVITELPHKRYIFTNENGLPDWNVPATGITFEGFGPYRHEDGTYRYIVNPMSPEMTLSGTYGEGEEMQSWEYRTEAVAGGLYYNKIGSGAETVEHNLQVGDYFLADGSLLPKDADPSLISSSDVIGIVFQLNQSRIGEAEKEALGGNVHALVMATKTVQNDNYFAWYNNNGVSSRDETEIGMVSTYDDDPYKAFELSDADINGYAKTKALREQRPEDYEAGYYEAFKAAADFRNEVGGPSESLNTTGWYMPSCGQVFDILRNLGGVTLNDSDGFIGSNLASFYWDGIGPVVTNLNQAMSNVSEENKNDFKNSGYYWTSSYCLDDEARYYGVIDFGSNVMCVSTYKSDILHVRSILAF